MTPRRWQGAGVDLRRALLPLLLVPVLAACGGDGPAEREAAATTPPPVSAPATDPAPGGAAPRATAAPSASEPAPRVSTAAGTTTFRSPTGRIACLVEGDYARCDVSEATYALPPEPPGCADADFGRTVELTTEGAGLSCVTDTVGDPDAATLAYGTGVRVGSVTCVSRETGVTCTDEGTGSGFRIARGSYDLF